MPMNEDDKKKLDQSFTKYVKENEDKFKELFALKKLLYGLENDFKLDESQQIDETKIKETTENKKNIFDKLVTAAKINSPNNHELQTVLSSKDLTANELGFRVGKFVASIRYDLSAKYTDDLLVIYQNIVLNKIDEAFNFTSERNFYKDDINITYDDFMQKIKESFIKNAQEQNDKSLENITNETINSNVITINSTKVSHRNRNLNVFPERNHDDYSIYNQEITYQSNVDSITRSKNATIQFAVNNITKKISISKASLEILQSQKITGNIAIAIEADTKGVLKFEQGKLTNPNEEKIKDNFETNSIEMMTKEPKIIKPTTNMEYAASAIGYAASFIGYAYNVMSAAISTQDQTNNKSETGIKEDQQEDISKSTQDQTNNKSETEIKEDQQENISNKQNKKDNSKIISNSELDNKKIKKINEEIEKLNDKNLEIIESRYTNFSPRTWKALMPEKEAVNKVTFADIKAKASTTFLSRYVRNPMGISREYKARTELETNLCQKKLLELNKSILSYGNAESDEAKKTIKDQIKEQAQDFKNAYGKETDARLKIYSVFDNQEFDLPLVCAAKAGLDEEETLNEIRSMLPDKPGRFPNYNKLFSYAEKQDKQLAEMIAKEAFNVINDSEKSTKEILTAVEDMERKAKNIGIKEASLKSSLSELLKDNKENLMMKAYNSGEGNNYKEMKEIQKNLCNKYIPLSEYIKQKKVMVEHIRGQTDELYVNNDSITDSNDPFFHRNKESVKRIIYLARSRGERIRNRLIANKSNTSIEQAYKEYARAAAKKQQNAGEIKRS